MICPLRSRPPRRAVDGDKAKKLLSHEPKPMTKRESLELVRAYYRIEDGKFSKRLFEMTKVLSEASQKRARD